MTNKQKIIVIGLDGATWQVLKPFMAKGELPALKKIMENGAYGTLMSTVPCRSATAIATFFTGKNPSKWGMLDFPCFDPDVINYEKIKNKAQSIWDILGKFGYKSAIINIPATHPPTPTNGVMISGFSPSEEEEYTYPKDFKESVKGFHSQRLEFLRIIYGKNLMGRKKELTDFYTKNIKHRYGIIKNVIKDEAFDFSIFWIDEPDGIQHTCWGQEALLLSFFREVDNMLKDIVDNNPDANIIIISDHGFEARSTHDFYPKAWLKKEGYLKLKGGWLQQWLIQQINTLIIKIPPRSKHIPRYRLIKFIYSIYNKFHNKNKKEKTDAPRRNWREVIDDRPSSKVVGIDWEKSIATNYDFWGIRIIRENLDRDYEEVREEMIEKLHGLKDENGEKIIKGVWKKEEMFQGSDILKYPDIVYLPFSKFEPTGFLPFNISQKKTALKGGGDHVTAREGVFVAFGPNIKKAGEIGEMNMVDIAPTILKAFNVPVPEDMDGKLLKEIFHEK